jgi:hypothetical protein
MPRVHRHRRRHRTMKGGFLDDLSNSLSSMWEKTKNATSSLTASTGLTGSTSSTSSYQTPMTTSTYGGRHSRRRKHMRGGFKDNTPTTGIASNAASYSQKTAQPHNWVGGRTRRRGRKGGFLGEVVNQAIVPFSILTMQQKYRKGGKTRRHRKH